MSSLFINMMRVVVLAGLLYAFWWILIHGAEQEMIRAEKYEVIYAE